MGGGGKRGGSLRGREREKERTNIEGGGKDDKSVSMRGQLNWRQLTGPFGLTPMRPRPPH